MPRQTCKFRLSRNSTKFDVLAKFHETIPTEKSVSSSEIRRINFRFLTEITILSFFQKLEISRVLKKESDKSYGCCQRQKQNMRHNKLYGCRLCWKTKRKDVTGRIGVVYFGRENEGTRQIVWVSSTLK